MRELGVVVFLTGFGIPAEAALTTSLLVGVCLIVHRITRWFIMAHQLGHHTSDPREKGRVAARIDP